MTFDEIVVEIAARLNLTSSEATTRIGRLVNRHYKKITTSIGVTPIARQSLTVSALATTGSAEIAFTSVTKINRVWYLGTGSRKQFLDVVSLDELREGDPESSDTPSRWATKAITGTGVTILIDTLAATGFSMKADAYGTVSTLATTNVPAFPEDFHDVLIESVLKDEYKKMEKLTLAKESKEEYEQRLSDLRMWGAKEKYLLIRQGQRPRGRGRLRDDYGGPS